MIATVVLPPLLAAGWFACTTPAERAIPVAQWAIWLAGALAAHLAFSLALVGKYLLWRKNGSL
jgi:hypothetical protein